MQAAFLATWLEGGGRASYLDRQHNEPSNKGSFHHITTLHPAGSLLGVVLGRRTCCAQPTRWLSRCLAYYYWSDERLFHSQMQLLQNTPSAFVCFSQTRSSCERAAGAEFALISLRASRGERSIARAAACAFARRRSRGFHFLESRSN